MTSDILQFAKNFSIFTIIVGLLSTAIYMWVPAIPIAPEYIYILAVMYVLTLVIIGLLINNMKDKSARFVNAFMLINFAKMILYTIILFVYAWLNREGAVQFILTFFGFYILFTTYEVIFLMKMTR